MVQTSTVALRPAAPTDCERFWKWRNDPGVRAWSFDSAPVPYDDHVRWFTAALADPAMRMFVVADAEGRDLGYVRCRLDGDVGELSIGLGPAARGRGYGSAALRCTVERLFAEPRVSRLRALVFDANAASIRAFERAGFTQDAEQSRRDDGALVYSVARSARSARV